MCHFALVWYTVDYIKQRNATYTKCRQSRIYWRYFVTQKLFEVFLVCWNAYKEQYFVNFYDWKQIMSKRVKSFMAGNVTGAQQRTFIYKYVGFFKLS